MTETDQSNQESLEKAIEDNPEEWKQLQKHVTVNKTKLVNWLMGQVLKANPNLPPQDVRNMLMEKLDA